MNKRKTTFQWTAAALAFTLLTSGAASAAELPGQTTGASAAVKQFTDVNAQHWALKHITKLSALGVIEGYEQGQFRPENPVSQQEVIVMAIRMMGLEQEVKQSQVETVLPFSAPIDNFFKPYIAYAFDLGLISVSEEKAAEAGVPNWGRKEATREWVAKLVIRTIGKQELADSYGNTPATFGDTAQMSGWASAYINAAVSLGIVTGFEDNTYRPQGSVTRAQMATFLSRAEKHLDNVDSSRVMKGYVLGLNDSKLTVMDSQEKTVQYSITPDTVIYNAKDDSRIPASSLKLTNEVYVIHSGNNALYVELTNDQQLLETFEGTLSKVYLNEMVISLQQPTGDKLFTLAPNVAVTDENGHGLSLSSIEGSVVEISRNPLLKEEKISRIVVKRAPVTKQAEGTITSINKETGQITFLEQQTGQTEVFNLASRTVITLQDGVLADISKLNVGDVVSYEVQSNELAKVTVTKQTEIGIVVAGKLSSINHDSRIVTITDAHNSLNAYYLADNAFVEIDGLPTASFYDIEVGDELELEIVNKKVVRASVTNRSIEEIAFASILSYSPDAKVLTIQQQDGKLKAYTLTDGTVIRYGSGTMLLSNFASVFADKPGKRVNVKASKDKIMEIAYAFELEGTVMQANTTTSELTIRTTGGQSLTLKSPTSITVNKQTRTGNGLAELKAGDQVRVTLTHTQDMIGSISVKTANVYKVISANKSTRKVDLKDENGTTYSIVVDKDEKIVSPGKTSQAFEQILADDYVRAVFVGSDLQQVILLNATRGKITAVDSLTNTLTVQDYRNGVQVIPASHVDIKVNGASSTTLSLLQPNDRVEIVKGNDDKVTVYVATAEKRVIQSYDHVLNQLVLKPSGTNSRTRYSLFSKAYFHKGSEEVAVTSFVENDEVTIYVLDNKIVEIEK